MEAATQQVDQAKLEERIGQAVSDAGAALNGVLVMLGGELGLWKALAGAGPLDRGGGCRAQRRARALRARVAGRAGRQRLPRVRPRGRHLHPAARAGDDLADEESPVFLLGGYRISSARRSRTGRSWWSASAPARASAGTSTTPSCSRAPSEFFRPGYRAHLVAEWIPALDGRRGEAGAGASVADIGCGHGVSSTADRAGVPDSTCRLRLPRGLDRAGARAGAPSRGRRTPASRSPPPRTSRPAATTSSASSTACTTWATRSGRWRHVRETLAEDGTVMLVEPFAADAWTGTSTRSGASTTRPRRCSARPTRSTRRSASGSAPRRARSGSRAVAEEAGFSRFRRATETPFNLVLEARP